VILELIVQGVAIALVIYFGLHLRQKLQTLQTTMAAQEKTIAAQAESMKAQNTVLQEFERLNKMMKEVINTVDAPAMLQRMQSYKELVDREANTLLKEQARQFAEQHQARVKQVGILAAEAAGKMLGEQAAHFIISMANAIPFIPPPKRLPLIEAAELLPAYKQDLRKFAEVAPFLPFDTQLKGLCAVGMNQYLQALHGRGEPPSPE
jgi:hypothetical protein